MTDVDPVPSMNLLAAADAAGFRRAVEALRDEPARDLVAQAICQELLPWTRTVADPVIDGPDYVAFMQAASNYLAVLVTHLESLQGQPVPLSELPDAPVCGSPAGVDARARAVAQLLAAPRHNWSPPEPSPQNYPDAAPVPAGVADTAGTWRCLRCGSSRWVAASLTGPVQLGGRAIRQCVPCGFYSGDPVPPPAVPSHNGNYGAPGGGHRPLRTRSAEFRAGVAHAGHMLLHAVGHAHGQADLAAVAAVEPKPCCQEALLGFALGMAGGLIKVGGPEEVHDHG